MSGHRPLWWATHHVLALVRRAQRAAIAVLPPYRGGVRSARREPPTIEPPGAWRLVPPRLCAGRLTVRERIKRYYEWADSPVVAVLVEHGWQSAYN